MKRGVIIQMPEGSRVGDVRADLLLRGFPTNPELFQIKTHEDFERDVLLVRVMTYCEGERWLPEVEPCAMFPRCDLDGFARMVADAASQR